MGKRIFNLDDDYFDNMLPNRYWLLGLLASDGNVTKGKYVTINQSGDDGLEVIEYIKKELKIESKIRSSNTTHQIAYSIYINSPKILEVVNKYNIIERKTIGYAIPESLLNDTDNLKYFLRGYIDGDGSVGVYGKENKMLCISFLCSNDMITQLKELSIFNTCITTYKNENYGDIRFNGINALKFGWWLYSDVNIIKWKKYRIFKEYDKNKFLVSPKMKFNFIRENIERELENNKDFKCSEYAKKHNLDTRYVWKNKMRWIKLKDKVDK